MSALGQKQTFAVQNVMSALPPKADIRGCDWHVRFVPIADIAHLRIEASIFLMLDDVGTDPKTGRLCRLARGSHLLCRF